MASITLPDEIQFVVDAEVREHGYADASEYVSLLVRQEQKRRREEAMDVLAEEGWESGDAVDMTADSWVELRRELHKQVGIE